MLIGGHENQTVRKNVVVLGGESRLKPKKQMETDSSGKKQKPYNHCMIYMIHIFVMENAFENFHQHYFLYF
jgi:hypothetical protein